MTSDKIILSEIEHDALTKLVNLPNRAGIDDASPNKGGDFDMNKPLMGRTLELPVHASVEAERLHRKQRLAVAFRLFAKYGFDSGLAGHITARDPEFPDQFWVNPFGVPFSRIRVSDLLLLSPDGRILHGDRPVNLAAFVIHSAVHHARPDAVAAAHSHSPHGKAWSTFGRPLDPLTQDACAFFEEHSVYDQYNGIVHDASEGERIAERLGANKAVILKNHGLLTVGGSVEAAAWWFIAMEDACRVQLLAEAAIGTRGKPDPIPDECARETCRMLNNPLNPACAFESLYQVIVAEQPDVLD